jgi:uncharacterized membrane protein
MARKFLTEEEQERIVEAIREAEKMTSGEIRVHLQAKCSADPYQDAQKVFGKLGMEATEQRNGVLFFMAYKSKKIAVLGDKGINEAVPEDFWQETVSVIEEHCRQNRFADALAAGVLKAGEALKKYFPYQSDDVNELDDGVSYA